MLSFVPLRSPLNLTWGEEIVLGYLGDICTAFVYASVGFGLLSMIVGLSPLVFQTNILDFDLDIGFS